MAEHPVLTELAVVVRSGLVESRHLGSLLALDADGAPVLALGDPDSVVLPRSTTKPLQALACLEAGAPLSGPALAIAAGSHTGQDQHVQVVRGILDAAGLDESALRCPQDLPEDEPTRLRMLRAGQGPSRVRMNCSGKHAAMLLACTANGWPVETYLDPEHPLQQYVRAVVARETGVPVSHTAVDGCGAALFGTTVRGLAAAFRGLILASDTPAASVASAMRTHPELVGGPGHPNTRLMAELPGVLAKGGAEGVIGVAGPDGQAVAMKMVDGSPRATTLVALAVLRGLGVDVSPVADLTTVPVLGGGYPVGEISPGTAVAGWAAMR